MSENNKYRLTITEAHNNMYKVEMTDKYCSYSCVYEPSVEQAMKYAEVWFANTEVRRKSNQAHAKAVMEMMAIDKRAGITTNMSDGLD